MAKPKKLTFDSPRRAYLMCVLNDPEFQSRVNRILENKEVSELVEDDPKFQAIENLAWDFDLDLETAVDLINGKEPDESLNLNRTVVYLNKSADEPGGPIIKILVFDGASKTDVLKAVEDIDEIIESVYGKQKTKRTKNPENYQLVYAIHRARRKGLKFAEIFEQYTLGKLENYKGSRGINSPNKFTEYYRKYEPEAVHRPGEIKGGLRPVEEEESSGGKITWILDADEEIDTSESDKRTIYIKRTGMNPKNIPDKDTL